MAKSEIEGQEENQVAITLPGASTTDFGSDELGQIRNLLIGAHDRHMQERIERVENEVLTVLAELRGQIEGRFDSLERSLAKEVDARTSVSTDLVTRLDEESKARHEAEIDLRTEFERHALDIHQKFGLAKSELGERIESVDADLRERSVDRQALAVLFERTAQKLLD